MDIKTASRIVGSQPKVCVQNMHKALGMLSSLNTAEENERREAAGVVLKNWNAHLTECQARHNERFKRRGAA